ncbi:DNA mismatch repair protein MutS [Roseovarius spongiae]|uniref:DNA mismatch repair protein MutS n=1 Tax=Roseovarius spongiae TaxID=2320272 RepID=A0A3A8B817_9RHOB|nr:Smr/MutS family protein [Roseovarius spongiae]RKF13384.1 DNA mismatch repair protein MutS [Roseovarius spongiae]
MSRRKLRPEELALWRKVAETADPLTRDRPQPAPARPFSDPEPSSKPKEQPPIAPFRVGERAEGALPGLTDRTVAMPVTMDKRAHTKLKRGKMKPEARIDLHGMTLDRAHGALTAFILRAHAQGKRLVLVITGKGKRSDQPGPIPVRQGVLRHNVPHWLQIPPLAQVVMQVSEAHGRHGGGGAYYVYLRRPRG